MSKTPFTQIQLPLSETKGTAAVEFNSKCPLVALRLFRCWDLLSAIQSIGDAGRQRGYFNLKIRLIHYPQRFPLSFFMQTGLVLRS